ncbi:MAG: 2-amino-4-hydroxy-6-hydroxymethyldihydropteridine diphosphokinase [Desulfobacteraceae bacterium]|nr:2-amino-4-hydroxy-6-hydroxymethyldihydropteridine diphosphokinase [Desulfobacteraceae bacterium]
MGRHPLNLVIISVGSNLGDKIANCRRGISELSANNVCSILVTSRFYATAPVDYLDQDWFINAAVKVETRLEPEALLDFLLAIQQNTGRTCQKIRFGPRVLDLDIIFFNDLVVKTQRLELPHPRMHKRRFVLKPICDIDPAVVHPVLKKRADLLLSELDDDDQKVILQPCCD